jgi:hypothetical protein
VLASAIARPRRNDRCPCGSGKKYKKCCLAKGVGGEPNVLPDVEGMGPAEKALDWIHKTFPGEARAVVIEQIVHEWISALVAPPPQLVDQSTGESLVLTTVLTTVLHYRIRNLEALRKALARTEIHRATLVPRGVRKGGIA